MRNTNVHARIVVGLGYGDEGKGSWVDHLVRKHRIKYVVRFNGGAQAAHHVVTKEGIWHKFSQFGSGTLVPGTNTIHARWMLVDPQFLFEEALELQAKGVGQPLSRMIISENCPVVHPSNRLLNRVQEIARGGSRHGSCGYGIGITQGDVEKYGDGALYVRDLNSPGLYEKLDQIAERRFNEARQFESDETRELLTMMRDIDLYHYVALYKEFLRTVRVATEEEIHQIVRENDTVFEGAQGVLLDQGYGFFPHCTRSNCTYENALTLLRESGFAGKQTKVGLLRGYGTRHGAGPFVTYDASLELPQCHNRLNPWQGEFRHGWFDTVTARYALNVVGGVDILAITNLDRMSGLGQVKVAERYQHDNPKFFSGSGREIHVETTDLKVLAERTEALKSVTPVYGEWFRLSQEPTEGWYEPYVTMLEKQLGHPVHAISAAPGPNKLYRF